MSYALLSHAHYITLCHIHFIVNVNKILFCTCIMNNLKDDNILSLEVHEIIAKAHEY